MTETGAGLHDGSSWADATSHLRSGILYSGATQVWVAAGTYKPTTGIDRGISFQLKNGVAVYGGFTGVEPVLDMRDPAVNLTILSGDIGIPDGASTPNRSVPGIPDTPGGDSGDNSYHVIHNPDLDPVEEEPRGTRGGSGTAAIDDTAVLDGFIVTAGNADGDGEVGSAGGGMLNENASPTIDGCTFVANCAGDYGGAMQNYDRSDPMVTNCTFTGKEADSDGGAVENYLFCSPTFIDCLFDGNSANGAGEGGLGGAMDNYENCSPTITNCTFINNMGWYGGAIQNYYDSNPAITDCTFSGNSAGVGGDVRGDEGGGGDGAGGGVYNEESSPTLTNCVFIDNMAWNGGAIHNNNGSDPTLINCTITGNFAEYGGGIYNVVSGPVLANCILWGNFADYGSNVYNDSSTPGFLHCIVEGSGAGRGGNLDEDPLFVDDQNPDGADGIPRTDDDGLRLLGGSPAIDAGTDAGVPPTDITGADRILPTDIGAYESFLPNTPPDFTAVAQNAVAIDLDWTDSDRETGYTIERSANGTTGWAAVATPAADATTHTDTGLAPDTTYYYRINASNDDGDSAWSDVADATTDPLSPDGAGIIYVNIVTMGAGDGSSWANATSLFQDAIDTLGVIQVWVAAGTYYPTDDLDRTISFQLRNGVAVYGGFEGTETELEARDPEVNPTILSGDIGAPDANSYHVIYNPDLFGGGEIDQFRGDASGIDETAVLDGFTITAGLADGIGDMGDVGGGILNENASPTIANCAVVGNTADEVGGGVFNVGSSPTFTNCTIGGNTTGDAGGGIYNYHSSSTFTNCTISGNSTGEVGGGIYNDYSSPTFTSCVVADNSADGSGGGMYNYEGSPELMSVTITGNDGGGFYNYSYSDPTLINCILWGNTAVEAGDNVHNQESSTPSFSHCIVEGSGGSTAWIEAFGGNSGSNVDADPLFMNAADIDGADGIPRTPDDGLHPRPASPAIDMGTDAGAPTSDITGASRLGTTDIGAYELLLLIPDENGIIYVTVTGAGLHDGSSWKNATSFFQLAIETVGVNHVRIEEGSYPGPIDPSLYALLLAGGHSPGVVTVVGDLTLGVGNTLEIEIDGATPTVPDFDQWIVTGDGFGPSDIILGNATLSLVPSYNPTAWQTFKVIDNQGPYLVSGTFAGLPEGSMITAGGVVFMISYVGGDGNDVVLRRMGAAPEIEVSGNGLTILTKGPRGNNFTLLGANTPAWPSTSAPL